jgi:hypothetical protein
MGQMRFIDHDMVATAPWYMYILAILFGEQIVSHDLSDQGHLVIISYLFRGKLYVIREKWIDSGSDSKPYRLNKNF